MATNDASLGDTSEPSSSHSDCSSHDASDSLSSTAESSSSGLPESSWSSACGDSTACPERRASTGYTSYSNTSCVTEHLAVMVGKLSFVQSQEPREI